MQENLSRFFQESEALTLPLKEMDGNVKDTLRLISMQSQPIQDTSREEVLEVSETSTQTHFQNLICSVEDFLASHSQWLENEEVLKIPEAHCFLKLQESLEIRNLRLYSLKTSKGYSITRGGRLISLSSKHFGNWGMSFNTWYLTADFTPNKVDKEFTSLEFLEETMDDVASQNWDFWGGWIRGRLKPYLQFQQNQLGEVNVLLLKRKEKDDGSQSKNVSDFRDSPMDGQRELV